MKKTLVAVAAFLVPAGFLVWSQDSVDDRRFFNVFAQEQVVCFRGEGRLVDSQAVITLPANFEGVTLSQRRTIQLTPRNGWSPLSASDLVAGKFTVSTTALGVKTQAFWWEVTAVLDHSKLPVREMHR